MEFKDTESLAICKVSILDLEMMKYLLGILCKRVSKNQKLDMLLFFFKKNK